MKLLHHQLKYFKIDSESPHFRDVNYSQKQKLSFYKIGMRVYLNVPMI